jgi:polygalacturonase
MCKSWNRNNVTRSLRVALLFTATVFTACMSSTMLSREVCAASQGQPSLCDVRNFGAKGDGIALDTQAINNAIRACAVQGGGIVLLKSGIFRSGTIFLLDRITLEIDQQATLLGSANLADYVHLGHASEGRDTALIVAQNVHDIAITGSGTIDGNGRAFIDHSPSTWSPSFNVSLTRQGEPWAQRMALRNEGPLNMLPRPGLLLLALHTNNLRLQDFHVVDSPNWTIKIGCSQYIAVDGLDVRNNVLIPNNDALDISTSTDATITNSYLQAGDDALVIGGPCMDGWCQQPAARIKVDNVTLMSRSAAIRVGPAAKGVHDVSFSHVTVLDSNRGILLHTRSDETVENISFSDIKIKTRLIDGPWWGAGEPISISVAHWDYVSWAKTTNLGHVRHIQFTNIVTSSDSPIVIYSTEPGHIEDISFRGLSVSMVPDALNSVLGGNLDLQPTSPINWGVRKQDLAAVWMHNVEGIDLTDVQIRWREGFPDFYTNGLLVDNFEGLRINHFTGAASTTALPAIKLQDGAGFKMLDAHASAGSLIEKQNVR